MAVTETGYQNYEMYNVVDDYGPSELGQIQISPNSSSTHVSASFVADGVARTLEIEGNFNITGNTLADVHGTMSAISSTQNGAPFWANTFSNGADFQAFATDYAYNLSLLGGNDKFTGSSAQAINDAVQTLDGNDIFTGYGDINGAYSWSGGDHFYGGNGIDTAVYRGSLSQYNIQQNATIQDARTDYTSSNQGKVVTDSVANRDGVDKLVDVERLSFSDTMVAFDIEGDAGQAYRLYQAAFDRIPDKGGLGYWIDQMDNGTSLLNVSNSFINSAEFKSLYGANPTDMQFIDSLYNNVLHRDPDQGGYDFWVGTLNAGVSRAQVLVEFSQSAENQAQTLPLVVNGIQYQQYGDLG